MRNVCFRNFRLRFNESYFARIREDNFHKSEEMAGERISAIHSLIFEKGRAEQLFLGWKSE